MTPRSSSVVTSSVCCACLAVFASLAFAVERERAEVRFQPGSAAPGAGWVGCGESGYWNVFGARTRSAWSACAAGDVDVNPCVERRDERARPAARDAAGYVDLGR